MPGASHRATATDRILNAALSRLVISGTVNLTLNEVAQEAGVSKGLIHYHFHDKETLLVRLVEWITGSLVDREDAALASSTAVSAIDDLWRWLESELQRGDIRVLLELTAWRSEQVHHAVRVAATARRDSAASSIGRLFFLLGLRSRIPPILLANVYVAFIDGLSASVVLDPTTNPRAAFDILWLSLLSLAE